MEEDSSELLIESLQDPALYDHPVSDFKVLETHISWVILTGEYAYKIKKPVNFGFLDFSTLELRRHYCGEEVRLNGRYAPDLYLAVKAIYGEPRRPAFHGSDRPIEYAVQMQQFPQEDLLSRLVQRGELQAAHIDTMAGEIAGFHARAAQAGPADPWGAPEQVRRWALENFDEIRPLLKNPEASRRLQALQDWTEAEYRRRQELLQERKEGGGIRECHGDLHLGNMFLQGSRIRLFDCIEFNEELRWIDVMAEVAFVVMDLHDRGRPDFARRFLSLYLQHTGDYAGLGLMRFYFVYRALVRAKVTLLRLSQGRLQKAEEEQVRAEYRAYVALAQAACHRPPPRLIITCGLSGSGKTHLAAELCEMMEAVHIRSDVERKRLFGYDIQARTGSKAHAGIYTQEASVQTYARLEEIAAAVLDGGYTVIVDAAFLQREQRRRFRELAQRCKATFVILAVHAPDDVLRERIRRRQDEGRDASEADTNILDLQLREQEALTPEESGCAVVIDSSAGTDMAVVAERLGKLN